MCGKYRADSSGLAQSRWDAMRIRSSMRCCGVNLKLHFTFLPTVGEGMWEMRRKFHDEYFVVMNENVI